MRCENLVTHGALHETFAMRIVGRHRMQVTHHPSCLVKRKPPPAVAGGGEAGGGVILEEKLETNNSSPGVPGQPLPFNPSQRADAAPEQEQGSWLRCWLGRERPYERFRAKEPYEKTILGS